MMDFDSLYSAHCDYVYQLCYRLEGEIAKAETLCADVWKQANAESESFQGADVSVRLCRLLAISHRRLGRRSAGDVAEADSVGQAVIRLAPEYRLPLVLKETGGLSYDAIGRALDIPHPTVRARLGRARALLRSRAGAPR